MKRYIAMAVGMTLTACAGDSTRWASSNREEVAIDGIPYKVLWLRAGDGIDAHAHNNEAFQLLPDPLSEKRRATSAMMTVATRECQGVEPSISSETNVEQDYTAHFKCLRPATVHQAKRP